MVRCSAFAEKKSSCTACSDLFCNRFNPLQKARDWKIKRIFVNLIGRKIESIPAKRSTLFFSFWVGWSSGKLLYNSVTVHSRETKNSLIWDGKMTMTRMIFPSTLLPVYDNQETMATLQHRTNKKNPLQNNINNMQIPVDAGAHRHTHTLTNFAHH